MNDILSELDLHLVDDLPICQGSVFNATVNQYRTSRGFGFTVRLAKAVRLFCLGCPNCDWEHDGFSEVSNDWPILDIETAKDDSFYRLDICNTTRDRETGIVDGWDLRLVEYLPPSAVETTSEDHP